MSSLCGGRFSRSGWPCLPPKFRLRHGGQAEGEAYARVAFAAEDVEGLTASRYDAYAEYGFADSWTVTAKAETVLFENNEDFNAEGFRATVRKELHRGDRFVVSVEAGILDGAAFGGAPDGCDTTGAEARVGAGWSGGFEDDREWFAFADLARSAHEGGCERDRLELGYGSRVVGDVYVVNQLWLERGSGNARSDKLETAIVWRAGFADVSVACREELSGRFDETGIVFALAKRF